MPDKIKVGVLFGGQSAEHEVSVRSAQSVFEAIDRRKYEVTMIGIDRAGQWLVVEDVAKVITVEPADYVDLPRVFLDYHGRGELTLQDSSGYKSIGRLDVMFPILHGPYGEDGTVQGLLELAGIAYVGSGVLGSAVGMDKDMMKRTFRAEGLPQVQYISVLRSHWRSSPHKIQQEIEATLSYPLFIKPANMGSSVGVSKVHNEIEFSAAMDEASRYDRKIVVEACVSNCREVECSVLGYEEPEVSAIGEVVPSNEFYDYNAKYIDDNSELIIPADLNPQTASCVRDIAKRAFLAVDASGLARVDFFIADDEETVMVNEINTLPGFTEISMYPKLWESSGVNYSELIDRLIELAMERHKDRLESTTKR